MMNDEYFAHEFYVGQEVKHYKHLLKDKVIYCNCDRYDSKFVSYFQRQSEIKELLVSSDDFRNNENIELLKQADIVVTNPPFSLFKEYVAQLVKHNKKFLIMAHNTVLGHKDIFTLLKDNKVWLGVNNTGIKWFKVNEYYDTTPEISRRTKDGEKYCAIKSMVWLTNLEHNVFKKELPLYKRYSGNKKDYPKYDNCNAINIDRAVTIPEDYKGIMGVPVSFLTKYNPKQFELIKLRKGDDGKQLRIGKRVPYSRVLIRNRKFQKQEHLPVKITLWKKFINLFN